MKRRNFPRIPKRGRALMRFSRMRIKRRVPTHYMLGSVFWIVSALFVEFQFAMQLSSGEIVGGLMRSFHITTFGAGILASSYYCIYVLLQVPAGLMVDTFGPRKLLSAGAFCCGAGAMLFATSHILGLAFLGRILMGFGGAFAFVGSISLVGRWFPHRYFSILVGLLESAGMIISLLSVVLVAHMVTAIDWRGSMWVFAIIGFGLSILLWVAIRDAPPRAAPASVPPRGMLWQELKVLLKQWRIWNNAIYSGLMYGVIAVFAGLWGVPYMQDAHHLDLVQAAFYANSVFIGVAIGTPVMGWLDHHLDRRKILLSVSALLAMVCITLVIYDDALSLSWVLVLMVLTGLFASSYMVPFAVAHQLATANTKAASIGFVNMWSVGVSPLLQAVIGYFLAHFALHQDGHLRYTLHTYHLSLLILPLIFLIGAISAWFIPRRPLQ